MIEISNISVWYGNTQALKDISLTVREGDFWALFGLDDAGKTSLLNVIMGFNTSYKGNVTIFGKNINLSDAQLYSHIRFVPDDIIWEAAMTAADYFACACGMSGNYNKEMQHQLCERFEIREKDYLLSMTYQENKLVQIIAAVCACPKILILDEPANFLGKEAYRILLSILEDCHERGMSIIVAAEKYEDVRGFCDHYAYLKEGSIAAVSEVTAPDSRSKMVTIVGAAGDSPEEYMTRRIADYRDRKVYLYEGNMKELIGILTNLDCADWSVEELTLEEELDADFERWE